MYLLILILIATAAAMAILFTLRYSRIYKPGKFAQTAWRICIIWLLVTLALSLIPIDYWVNPPFKKIIKLPKKAEIVSCYKSVSDKREGFDNPWGDHSTFKDSWFNRRGFKRVMGKKTGESITELDSIALKHDTLYAICVYKESDTQNAILIQRSWGGGSGDHYIKISLFQHTNNGWTEITKKEYRLSDIDVLFTRWFATLFTAAVLLAVILIALAVFCFSPKKEAGYIGPLHIVFLMVPAITFCVLTATVAAWLIVPATLEGCINEIPWQFLLTAIACFILGYGIYRFAAWKEKR